MAAGSESWRAGRALSLDCPALMLTMVWDKRKLALQWKAIKNCPAAALISAISHSRDKKVTPFLPRRRCGIGEDSSTHRKGPLLLPGTGPW